MLRSTTNGAKNLDASFAPDLQLPLPKAMPVTSCIYFRVGCHGGHQICIGFDLRKPSGLAVSFAHAGGSDDCMKGKQKNAEKKITLAWLMEEMNSAL